MIGIDFAENDTGAITARRHFTNAFARVIGVRLEFTTRIVCGKRLAQAITRLRDYPNTTPIGVINLHHIIELLAGPEIALWPDDFGIAIVQVSPTRLELFQH